MSSTARKIDFETQPEHSEDINVMKEEIKALNRAQAVIEFDLDGRILNANDNFLATVGYSLDEIRSNHHSMFCEPAYASSPQYRAFWQALNKGEYVAGEFKRFGKNGKEVWINASYNPIFNENGVPFKVVKFATDVTKQKTQQSEFESKINAISRVQAVIEFQKDGTIVTANENFTNTVGYSLGEIQGKHHSMFCDPAFAASAEYKEFWAKLGRGEYAAAEFKRFGKGGKEIWINASYNPIFDADGKVVSVVKFATDITAAKTKNAEIEAKLAAISRAQAVIEFNLDGSIITANDNFTNTVGYALNEIQGQHHSMFCDPAFVRSQDYKDFWAKLGRGEFVAAEFKRFGKGGKEIWINASYNPIFDANGKPFKVVKFATDVTAAKMRNIEFEGKMEAISKAQAVIEFNLDGTIISANENFLKTLGYSMAEIQGKHHRMFCEGDYSRSADYENFWKKLNKGEFDSGRYLRVGAGGKQIWIQATYNPIMDMDGRPYKVVKFASDITEQVKLEQAVKLKAEEDQRKVDELLVTVSKASQGDLTAPITVSGVDALGQLASGIDKMIQDLRAVIGKVVISANGFGDSSKSISIQSDSVASGAQSLGATVEEMNASIEEFTASIDSIADNTKKANELAKVTQKEAEIGSQAIAKSIEAMELINKSSEDISEIIKVISEIASQTNLLAFNAAIEAARAGEHGLGFSVVADEVRKLAERSSQATKEISKLINESVKRVEQGSSISKQAGEAFGKIVSGIEKTTQSISEVNVAAEEQSEAAKGVSAAIQHIATESEKSAQASESIANSTRSLVSGAEELNQTVSRFVV
ncbi:PAS domain-containing protein [Bdellovibrio sp. NC01]|uniref:methyl-accepting chemotaxis protein n=1 Tax=Bdellovibrio sp. NC01 TaxID=2220073 RepID=UPI00115A911A|nr:PAS domain-containing protein [Bdellovibrio sp. NC01]QDK38672.1 chemotaxis protein [Bdellovibrio sp. NC01]